MITGCGVSACPAGPHLSSFMSLSYFLIVWKHFEFICSTSCTRTFWPQYLVIVKDQVYDQGRHALLPLPSLPQGEPCAPLPTLVRFRSHSSCVKKLIKNQNFNRLLQTKKLWHVLASNTVRTWWLIGSRWKHIGCVDKSPWILQILQSSPKKTVYWSLYASLVKETFMIFSNI